MKDLPLQPLLVLELGDRVATSVCGSLLAQLGAEVAFVETAPDQHSSQGKMAFRPYMAAGKRSLVPRDRDGDGDRLLQELAGKADIVLTSSDTCPQYASLLESVGPDQIVCDTTAFGAVGPAAGAPWTERQIQARSGIMDTTGLPSGLPVSIDFPLVEFMTGAYGAAAVLAALRVRRIQGFSQRIDMALYDCAFGAVSTFIPRVLVDPNAVVNRVGNRHSMAAPWNVYLASDGWILMCAASDDQWRRICEVIEAPALGADPRYARLEDRLKANEAVDAFIQAWVGRHGVDECVRRLNQANIACGPIVPVGDYPREKNLEYRGMIREVAEPLEGGRMFIPSSPLRMSRTPGLSAEHIPLPDDGRKPLAALLEQLPRATSSGAGGTAAAALPLAGIKVIEIGHYTTVPLSARHLANLGAEVIKIEPPGGEAVRAWPPARHGKGIFFCFTNSDKRSLVLDLHLESDAGCLKHMIADADIVLENLKPGALAKLGFTPAAIAELNPRAIYCAVSGFGHQTVYQERPAFDTVIQAMSGVMDLIRSENIPLKSGPSSSDIIGAEIALTAVLAALEYRDATGKGQYIDLSMQDISAWLTQTSWNGWNARLAQVGQVMRCADGAVYAEGTAAALAQLDQAAFGVLSRHEAVLALERAGLTAAAVQTVGEMAVDPQTTARHLWFSAQDETGETWPLLSSPLRLMTTKPVVQKPMGALGADSDAILARYVPQG